MGETAYYHAFFSLLISSLLVFGGAALYYGRPYGFTILKSAIGLQIVYIAFVELVWLVQLPRQINGQPGNPLVLAGATAVAVLAGGAASTGLLVALWLLHKHQPREGR